ncbi:hypothetical protein SBA2_260108 [Acidobacteriia bacterium SbA2]|nr:hypothetical protein SBA2_260108 [Acidobacteriia bacterium SbA2]
MGLPLLKPGYSQIKVSRDCRFLQLLLEGYEAFHLTPSERRSVNLYPHPWRTHISNRLTGVAESLNDGVAAPLRQCSRNATL